MLIELGVPGGRCGCRSVNDALALAQRVSDLPGLRLRGLELHEGVLHGDDPQPQVEALLQQAAALACRMEPLVDGEFILTGAGTVWYDVVCNIWLAAAKPRRCRIVIRPGCYITHDRGIYDLAQQELIARDPIACDLAGDLTSALELMAMVQSVPEADRAVVNFGKRDCAFDAGLPQPIAHYRNGQQLALRAESIVSTGIMDQHCMLRLAPGSDVQVGDILLFGTSHPCLTFDKWKTLLLVDDDYNVLDEPRHAVLTGIRIAALRALPGLHNPRRSVARLSVARAGGCIGQRRFAPYPPWRKAQISSCNERLIMTPAVHSAGGRRNAARPAAARPDPASH